MHIRPYDRSASDLQGTDKALVLCVDLFGPRIRATIGVHKKSGKDDSRLRRLRINIIYKVVHPITGIADVNVLDGIVGPGVDQDQIRLIFGCVRVRLIVHLVDDQTWPSGVLIILHGSVGIVSDHVHLVAGVHNGIPEAFAISITIAGGHAVCDGCAQRLYPQEDTTRKASVRLVVASRSASTSTSASPTLPRGFGITGILERSTCAMSARCFNQYLVLALQRNPKLT